MKTKVQRKPVKSKVAVSIARLIPRLADNGECWELVKRLREQSSKILSAKSAAAAKAAFDSYAPGAILMRAENIALWNYPIAKGERCVVQSKHVGRKHIGFWVTVESELKPGSPATVWIPIHRAADFVPYVAPADPKAVEQNRREEAGMAAIIGMANRSELSVSPASAVGND